MPQKKPFEYCVIVEMARGEVVGTEAMDGAGIEISNFNSPASNIST